MKKLEIRPSFWAAVAAVWLVEPELLLPTALAAACHELGHIVVLGVVGGKIDRLTLAALGAELKLSGPLSYARELPVALAGPLVSLALALAAAGAGRFLLAGVSLALGLFNLLPIWPLDGGRAVACVCGMLLPPPIARRIEGVFTGGALGVTVTAGTLALIRGWGVAPLAMALWLLWRSARAEKNP